MAQFGSARILLKSRKTGRIKNAHAERWAQSGTVVLVYSHRGACLVKVAAGSENKVAVKKAPLKRGEIVQARTWPKGLSFAVLLGHALFHETSALKQPNFLLFRLFFTISSFLLLRGLFRS